MKLWDIIGDSFNSFEKVAIFKVANNLLLDEPNLEAVVSINDGSGNEVDNCEVKDEDVMEV